MFEIRKSGVAFFLVFFFPAGLKILVKLYFPMETSGSERSFDINCESHSYILILKISEYFKSQNCVLSIHNVN